MKKNDLNYASSNYLIILQCSFSTIIDSGCTNTHSYDATVYCCKCINISLVLIIFVTDATSIWNNNPFPGMTRLQGGSYK